LDERRQRPLSAELRWLGRSQARLRSLAAYNEVNDWCRREPGGQERTSPSYPGSGAELFADCTRLGLEGLVAKRLDGRYYPGQRREVWVKAKCSAWVAHHARHRHEPRH
jgi:ATP-dependent DNA ligase